VSELAADYPWEERESNDKPVTEGSLRKLIREELATLQQPKETTRTWAAVAASGVVPNKAATMRTIPAEPTKIVPARHLREVVIEIHLAFLLCLEVLPSQVDHSAEIGECC